MTPLQYSGSKPGDALPVHKPDEALWDRIEARLDLLDADKALAGKLAELPVHSPDKGTWALIAARLNRTLVTRRIVRISAAAAASLLVLFTAWQLTERSSMNPVPTTAGLQKHRPAEPAAVSASGNKLQGITADDKTAETASAAVVQALTKHSARQLPAKSLVAKAQLPETIAAGPAPEILVLSELNSTDQEPGMEPVADLVLPSNAQVMPLPEYRPAAAMQASRTKYYTPGEPKTAAKNSRFALAMNYQPENIANGSGNSLFHNVDLAASYNRDKFRVNTSLGMAYNQERYEYELNYSVLKPVTAVGPTGTIDTVMYLVNDVATDYQGTSNHQYLTYNLGVARKLFTMGKLSSWLNAAAGFALKVDKSSTHQATGDALKIMYNAVVHDVSETKAAYNSSSINFVTGLDLNYRVFDRLSLVVTPTGRWYFKPMLTQNNKATDEFTMGLRTGIKFDF